MARIRKPKQGYVYLLEARHDYSCKTYKFGCTTLTPEKRCKRVNYEYKSINYGFKVIASFKSFDIYEDERNMKCKILDGGFGVFSEVFNIDCDDELNCRDDVINRFLTIGGVIKRGFTL